MLDIWKKKQKKQQIYLPRDEKLYEGFGHVLSGGQEVDVYETGDAVRSQRPRAQTLTACRGSHRSRVTALSTLCRQRHAN